MLILESVLKDILLVDYIQIFKEEESYPKIKLALDILSQITLIVGFMTVCVPLYEWLAVYQLVVS